MEMWQLLLLKNVFFIARMINNEQSLIARPPPPIDQHSRVQRVFFWSIRHRALIVFCFLEFRTLSSQRGPLVHKIQLFSSRKKSNPDEDAL